MNTSNESDSANASASTLTGNLGEQAPAAPTFCEELYDDVMTDIHDMLDYVRAEGTLIPDDLREKIAQLICEKDEAISKGAGDASKVESGKPAEDNQRNLSLVLEVHGRLCQIVQPANPRTIRASRFSGKYKFFADNITVKLLLWASILSLATFLLLVSWQTAIAVHEEVWGQGPSTNAESTVSNTQPQNSAGFLTLSNGAAGAGTRNLSVAAKRGEIDNSLKSAIIDILIILAGASLGSAFYGLYTAHKYLVNCTFDPKYHRVYIIRYVLGLTSGTILGFFGKDSSFFQQLGTKQQLGAAVLALVGGYAAEAVSQILQRIAETLVTTVRGGNNEALQAKEAELKAKAKQQETQTKGEIVKSLLRTKDALLTAHGPNSPATAEVQRTIDALSR